MNKIIKIPDKLFSLRTINLLLVFILLICSNLQANTIDSVVNQPVNPFPELIVNDDNLDDIWALEQEYERHPQVARAVQLFEKTGGFRLISKLTGDELLQVPVGVTKTFGRTQYTIVVTRMRLLAQWAELEIMAEAKLPDGRRLFFGVDNLKFSSEGGIIGDATLGLFADFPISQGGKKMAVTLQRFQRDPTGLAHGGTYITIDCDGFVEMKVAAGIDFSRDWILPIDPNGNLYPGNQKRVHADASLTVTDWDDWLTTLDVPGFVLTQQPDVGFRLRNVVIDLSDHLNAPGFKLPVSPFQNDVMPVAPGFPISTAPEVMPWRGVYARQVEILLPSVFNQSETRLSAGAENLYIQSDGVTGDFFVKELLPYDKGDMEGWPWSVDYLEAAVFQNKFYKFEFSGRLGLPVQEETESLRYAAFGNLAKQHYNFSVATDSTLHFPMFRSQVTLLPGSKLSIEVKEGKFSPKAVLTGNLKINIQDKNENTPGTLEIAKVDFTKLIIQPQAPYIGLAVPGGSMSLTSNGKLNGMPLTLQNVGLSRAGEREVRIRMGISVNLMSEADGGIKATSMLGIVAGLDENNGRQRWRYRRLELDSLGVEIILGKDVYINGYVKFMRDHPVFGDGFEGSLLGRFVSTGGGNEPPDKRQYKFNMSVAGAFGKVPAGAGESEVMRYWRVDAFLQLSDWGIPIFPPVEINGFGGGAYHHMKIAGHNLQQMAASQGVLSSGLDYRPDPSVAFGLKAAVGLKGTGGSFSGLMVLEMVFGERLSLQQILLYGKGEFVKEEWLGELDGKLSDLSNSMQTVRAKDKREAENDTGNKITAAVFLQMDFTKGFELQGSFGAFMDAAGGKIKGQGIIDLVISPNQGKWHLYIGGYADESIMSYSTGQVVPPVSVDISYGSFAVHAHAYFMTGNDIPGPPPLEKEVADYFKISTQSNNRALLQTGGRSAASGTGFAFGAHMFVDAFVASEKTCQYCPCARCGLFSPCEKEPAPKGVHLYGGAGFDISLLKYDIATSCSNTGTSPHGLRGWRAGGNIWAMVGVKGGKWGFLGQCIRLPTINTGILFEADVPNPSYFQAAVKIEVIGLKINLNAKIGDPCGLVVN